MYFKNRAEAGRLLASELLEYRVKNCAVVALSPGAVLVGAQIAMKLHADLMMLLTENIVLPGEHQPLAGLTSNNIFTYNNKFSTGEIEEMLDSYGVKESGLLQLIHAAYATLGLQSYLTAGEKEVRAWTIHKGATAPQAAGVIHGDFEKGFIAAQIVDYNDLLAAGSEIAAKSAGKIRTEGKTYVMQPDDVVEFRFNV